MVRVLRSPKGEAEHEGSCPSPHLSNANPLSIFQNLASVSVSATAVFLAPKHENLSPAGSPQKLRQMPCQLKRARFLRTHEEPAVSAPSFETTPALSNMTDCASWVDRSAPRDDRDRS